MVNKIIDLEWKTEKVFWAENEIRFVLWTFKSRSQIDSKKLPIALIITLLIIYLLAIFKIFLNFFSYEWLMVVRFYIEQKFYKLF